MPGHRRLPRATPESQGLSSRAVTAFLDGVAATGQELHSLMVVVNGTVVAEGWWAPYERERPQALFSLSKSFTSTAVGFARAEGLLTLDDLVLDHFPDVAPPEPGADLAGMRVRHLLTMTTGHHDAADATLTSPDWARAFLALPVEHEPGTHFVYNTAATYMLAAIVQKVTGERLLDYLTPRLLAPLGIEGATWEQSPQGVDTGGFGLAATTEDIACFAQLYRRDGVWQGRRVLPEGWVAEATRAHTPSAHSEGAPDWDRGYGYQFWRGRHGTYRGDGAFGQYALVLPEQDAVVAITSGTGDMQGVLDLVWAHLLPAISPATVLDPDPDAEVELRRRLADLRIDPPVWTGAPPRADEVAGRRVAFEPNPFGLTAAMLEPGADRSRITVRLGNRSLALDVGHGAWVAGRLPYPPDSNAQDPKRVDLTQPVVAGMAWVAPDTVAVEVRGVDEPFAFRFVATIDGSAVRVAADVNVWFGDTHLADLTGRLDPT